MSRATGVILAFLVALCVICLQGDGVRGAATFEIRNECPFTVWAAGTPVGGGKQLQTGESWSVHVPSGTTVGRFWGRTGCSFDGSGRGKCTTGDCGGLLNCQAWGNVPATLAEYALNQWNNLDFFDISLVDGFNLRMSMVPSNSQCKAIACNSDINSKCPKELKVADGCKSACAAFNTPQYCCVGAFFDNCPPTDYSRFFKKECRDAYSYARDDPTSTFTCPSDSTNYKVVFCPKTSANSIPALESWSGENCCEWNGILCNEGNGRVINVILDAEPGNPTASMRGTISESIGKLSFLQKFILFSWKNITGPIPSSISELQSLTHFTLDNNMVCGSIPASIGFLPNLESLSLSNNLITGCIPQSISNLQNLKGLYLDGNRLRGSIPDSIGNLSGLSVLHLKGNLISGLIPESIGGLENVSTLDLSQNYLTGSVPSSIGNLSRLAGLLVSENLLNGSIPSSLGFLGHSLSKLSLDRNLLTGEIPESFANLTVMYHLDLSHNQLTGNIRHLRKSSTLTYLILSNNLLSGTVPQFLGSLASLRLLQLSFNNFTGPIPDFDASAKFGGVVMSNNKLTGGIPESFAKLEYLEYLDLSNNELDGRVPQNPAFYNLVSLNLSGNSLSGPLPNLTSIGVNSLDLSYNNLSFGSIPAWITESSFLTNLGMAGCGICMSLNDWEPAAPNLYISIDLSNNCITGDAGDLFEEMTELKSVNLARNQLSGSIPSSIENVQSLEVLDLSYNDLEDTIPEEMVQLKNLRQLNLSYNHLCGQIPDEKPLNSFPASAFDHNDCLCGSPLPPCQSAQGTKILSRYRNELPHK